MLTPGTIVNGYKVLIVHIAITDSDWGTYLAWDAIDDTFRVGDILTSTDETDVLDGPRYFQSYTNALGQFNRMVDEEAFLHDSGQSYQNLR